MKAPLCAAADLQAADASGDPVLDPLSCRLDGTQVVEASAGTGKTWNLCVLFLRLLLERGLELRQILVVTFTKAATAELQSRIRQRLLDVQGCLQTPQAHEEAHQGGQQPVSLAAAGDDGFALQLIQTLQRRGVDPALMRARVQAALASFDEASIFTIHGFCQRALADAPFAAGLPLRTEVDLDDEAWVEQAARDFWRRHVSVDTLPRSLAVELARRKDSPLSFAALLARRLEKPTARLRWPEQIAAAKAPDEAALRAAQAAARELWIAQRDAIVQRVLDARDDLKQTRYKPAAVQASAQAWDRLLGMDDALLALGQGEDKLELLDASVLARSHKSGRKPPVHPFFTAAQRLLEEQRRARHSLALLRLGLLRRLLEEGVPQVRAAKQQQRVVGYDDMLFRLYERLLEPQEASKSRGPSGAGAPAAKALAAALRQRFPAALIDEFQDTDPVQHGIFEAVHGTAGLPLFFIGDPKQAIYRFRNADLHTYLRARRAAAARHSLRANQRATPELIEAQNALFGLNPKAFMLDELRYQPVHPGDRRRRAFSEAQPGAPLQIWQLELTPGGFASKAAARQAVANACALEIARMLHAAQQGHIRLDGEPLQAGHIAVLVGTHAEGRLVRQALEAAGVGSVQLSPRSVWSTPQAQDLQRLLAAVLEPSSAGLLRTALATPFMGLAAAELDPAQDTAEAISEWMERFAAWRSTWLRRGVGVMLRQWMAQQAVAQRLLALPEGARRVTNLLHLVELLHEAGARLRSPDALMQWLQRQRRDGPSGDALQLRLDSDRHLVQIVTVHRSKGLEYPVVFCPYLWDEHSRAKPAGAEPMQWHDDGGALVLDMRPADSLSPEEAQHIGQGCALEDAAERMRLIYVALTRAQHRCVVVAGQHGKPGKTGEFPKQSRCSVLNWLVAGAGSTPAQWLNAGARSADITAAWQALARCAPGHIEVTPLPTGHAVRLPAAEVSPEQLALPQAFVVPAGWRTSSYSGLMWGTAAHGASGAWNPVPAQGESSAADRDLRTTLPAPGDTPHTLPPDDILHFPRGAEAGTCLHAVLERVDFQDPSGWDAAITDALRSMPLAQEGMAMVRGMLKNVLHTPLPVGTPRPLVLAQLSRARRLHELEFHLSARSLQARALNEALAAWGYEVPVLSFGALQGYLHGYIDMVLEHEGRFFVLDWKSNHLGHTASHYAAEPLARAMAAEGYHLQHLLYTVALHRMLAQRLQGYDPEHHLGGALYLFVRGVRPHWQSASGQPCGLVHHRPRVEVIEQLSRMMGEPQLEGP